MASNDVPTFDNNRHPIHFGKSFRSNHNGLELINFDFLPQSIDSTAPAQLQLSTTDSGVSVMCPNQKGGVTTFKGHRRPANKEAIIIYNKRTGQFTIETLQGNSTVKKTRDAGPTADTTVASKLPVSTSKPTTSSAPRPAPAQSGPAPQASAQATAQATAQAAPDRADSDSLSEDSLDSESEQNIESLASQLDSGLTEHNLTGRPHGFSSVLPSVNASSLAEDLHLSDSESDSD